MLCRWAALAKQSIINFFSSLWAEPVDTKRLDKVVRALDGEDGKRHEFVVNFQGSRNTTSKRLNCLSMTDHP